jgi:DNA repair protein RadC
MNLINAEQEVKICQKMITDWDKEHSIGIYLDANNNIKRKELISLGGLDISLAHPRDVIKPALIYGAVGILLLHNHPSNHLKPSKADLLATKRLVGACKVMGVLLVDHIIFCKKSLYYSMRANKNL